MTMILESSAFQNNDSIPMQYSKEGENISPPLEWSNVPDGTVEFAIIMEDPDAPQPEPFVHWLLYKIQPHVRKLAERISLDGIESGTGDASLEGKNSFGEYRYGGPLPPIGDKPHRYNFSLFALRQNLSAKAGMTKEELLNAMNDHILEKAELIGTYQRSKINTRKTG
ncbi:MAG: hypothetical protein JWQ35_523 [Bacteriovoracaceae bacterium]|nr:hypothetical protein [Bacteriovoracaceae bacterium]